MAQNDINQDLRARFNPDGSKLRTLQLKLLGMLEFIDKICRDNNIPYWLSSGTLIGAVRHGGFIPWDDDVDIEMLPEDFKRFQKAFDSTPQSDYLIQTSRNDPGFPHAFAKLRDKNSCIHEWDGLDSLQKYKGVYIDIFILRPSCSRLMHRLSCKLLGTSQRYYVKHHDSAPGKLVRFFAQKVAIRLLRIVNEAFPAKYLRHTIPSFFPAPRRREDIFPLSEVAFEGKKFYAPGNTDAYLRRIYGDYMQLPPLDKIQPHTTDYTLTLP